jgi:hypothetical protein
MSLPKEPVWSRMFDTSPRHCWVGKDDVRYLDKKTYAEGDDGICRVDHSGDPKVVGEVEWMRFIHAVPDVLGPEVSNPFASDGMRLLNGSAVTSEGVVSYAETYLREHTQDWGLDVVVRVFLNREANWARVELYDVSLVPAFEAAMQKVEETYR